MLALPETRPMKQLDDLPMTFFAAAVSVSPLASLGGTLAPLEAQRLLLSIVEPLSGVLLG